MRLGIEISLQNFPSKTACYDSHTVWTHRLQSATSGNFRFYPTEVWVECLGLAGRLLKSISKIETIFFSLLE